MSTLPITTGQGSYYESSISEDSLSSMLGTDRNYNYNRYASNELHKKGQTGKSAKENTQDGWWIVIRVAFLNVAFAAFCVLLWTIWPFPSDTVFNTT